MFKYILTSLILVTNLSIYCSEKNSANKEAKRVADQAKIAQAAVAKANILKEYTRNMWNCDVCGKMHRGRTVASCTDKLFAPFFAHKP